MKAIETVLRSVTLFGGLIGVLCIVGLMVLTVVTVVFRFMGIAFPGTYVLAELLLIPSVSFSLAYAAWRGAHTRVELFIERLGPRLAGPIDAAMMALGTVFWFFVAFAGAREAIQRGAEGEMTMLLDIPVWPFRWLMVAAIALFCLVLLFQAVRALRGLPVAAQAEREDFSE
ncbi:MAG: TRAP transporter small permease [Azospirillaceae bacterium]